MMFGAANYIPGFLEEVMVLRDHCQGVDDSILKFVDVLSRGYPVPLRSAEAPDMYVHAIDDPLLGPDGRGRFGILFRMQGRAITLISIWRADEP
jgi:hypothetical protein